MKNKNIKGKISSKSRLTGKIRHEMNYYYYFEITTKFNTGFLFPGHDCYTNKTNLILKLITLNFYWRNCIQIFFSLSILLHVNILTCLRIFMIRFNSLSVIFFVIFIPLPLCRSKNLVSKKIGKFFSFVDPKPLLEGAKL